MSWKSLVTAGLLCVVASPAYAAPSVSAVAGGTQAGTGGHLNAQSQWVWTIRLAQSNPVVDLPDPDGAGPEPDPTPGSPLAAELGFTSSNATIPAGTVIATPATFDDPNPGNVIFGWETLTNLGGTGACDSATPGNCPVGLQVEPAGADPINEVFVAYGSIDLGTNTAPQNFLTITTARPVTANAAALSQTTITMSGTYGGGNNMGRIAELNQAWDPTDDNPPASLNYDTYAGDVTRQAKGGDTNLDGNISIADYATLEANFGQNPGTRQWYHGDYNGDNNVTIADYAQLESNFGTSYTVFVDTNINDPGAGGGGGVPEPASMALVALALLGVTGLRCRR